MLKCVGRDWHFAAFPHCRDGGRYRGIANTPRVISFPAGTATLPFESYVSLLALSGQSLVTGQCPLSRLERRVSLISIGLASE